MHNGMCTSAGVRRFASINMNVHIQIYIYVYIHTYIHTDTHTVIHTYIYVFVQMYRSISCKNLKKVALYAPRPFPSHITTYQHLTRSQGN